MLSEVDGGNVRGRSFGAGGRRSGTSWLELRVVLAAGELLARAEDEVSAVGGRSDPPWDGVEVAVRHWLEAIRIRGPRLWESKERPKLTEQEDVFASKSLLPPSFCSSRRTMTPRAEALYLPCAVSLAAQLRFGPLGTSVERDSLRLL